MTHNKREESAELFNTFLDINELLQREIEQTKRFPSARYVRLMIRKMKQRLDQMEEVLKEEKHMTRD